MTTSEINARYVNTIYRMHILYLTDNSLRDVCDIGVMFGLLWCGHSWPARIICIAFT